MRDWWGNLKRIWAWLPFLWRIREYDPAFLLNVVAFQLRRMADYQEKHKRWVGVERAVHEMRLCATLLDRVQDENIAQPFFDAHYKKWGELRMTARPTDRPNFVSWEYSHTKALTHEDKERERREALQIFQHEEKMREAALDEFWRIFRRKYHTWWD